MPFQVIRELLVERIILQSGADLDSLHSLKKIAISQGDCWTFRDLIVESGLLTKEGMNQIVRGQIFGSVAKLVSIEKGRFGIALRECEDIMGEEEVRLEEGIEINEVLLEVAKSRDEDAFADSARSLVQGDMLNIGVLERKPESSLIT